nr:zinc finger ccch domain-containing protein 30 [Quercus suber]
MTFTRPNVNALKRIMLGMGSQIRLLLSTDELGKHHRSSSFELGNNGEEPDLSWVQSLAKESPTNTKEKIATLVSIVASSNEGSNMSSQIELVGHVVSRAWLE